jgi:ribonuclease HII
MEKAVAALKVKPDYLLIDGRIRLKNLAIAQKSIVRGDQQYACIAAASIIAKVMRDHLMLEYHEKYPLYGFNRHMGYGTREHFRLLKKHGPCEIHRRSFAPIANSARRGEGITAPS